MKATDYNWELALSTGHDYYFRFCDFEISLAHSHLQAVGRVGSNCSVDVEKQHWRNKVNTKSCRLWINMWNRFRVRPNTKSTILTSSRLLPNSRLSENKYLFDYTCSRIFRGLVCLGARACRTWMRHATPFYLFIYFPNGNCSCVSIARATTARICGANDSDLPICWCMRSSHVDVAQL